MEGAEAVTERAAAKDSAGGSTLSPSGATQPTSLTPAEYDSVPGGTGVAACGDERPHEAHVWKGVAKLEVGTKYGTDWRCPGVAAALEYVRAARGFVAAILEHEDGCLLCRNSATDALSELDALLAERAPKVCTPEACAYGNFCCPNGCKEVVELDR